MTQTQTWTGFVATLLIVFILGAYAALEPIRMETAQARLQERSILAASQLYGQHCAACHGPQGEGARGNPALDDEAVQGMDIPTLTRIVARGSGDVMPPASLEEGGVLTAAQIDQLVLLVKSGEWSQVRARLNAPGNLALFADNCAGCHGANGEGSNFGPRLNTRRVQERLTRERLAEIIEQGTADEDMPGFADMLTPEEIGQLVNLLRHWPELVGSR